MWYLAWCSVSPDEDGTRGVRRFQGVVWAVQQAPHDSDLSFSLFYPCAFYLLLASLASTALPCVFVCVCLAVCPRRVAPRQVAADSHFDAHFPLLEPTLKNKHTQRASGNPAGSRRSVRGKLGTVSSGFLWWAVYRRAFLVFF